MTDLNGTFHKTDYKMSGIFLYLASFLTNTKFIYFVVNFFSNLSLIEVGYLVNGDSLVRGVSHFYF